MKILFVSGNLCDGGAQRVIAVVSGKLAEMGHEVSLLLYSRNEKEYPLSPLVRLSSLGNSFEEYSQLSSIQRIRKIRAYLKEAKPDVAIGFLEGGYGLYLSSFGMKHKKVASARIDPVKLLEAQGLRAKIDLRWFASADAVVLQTEGQKERVSHVKWKKKTVISNPISQAALEYPEHEYERPCRRIVMAGRLADQKNYKMAFEAMQAVRGQYPDAVLDVFGKGEKESELQSWIEEYGLTDSIHLRGWSQCVTDEYAESDLYLMTSDFEGMPNALMEAMAVGLPCISTDCPTGPSDLIEDGKNGYLVPMGDVEALGDRMLRVMAMSTEERRAMGQAAHDTLQTKFNVDAIAKQWETLLLDLCENK